MLLSPRRDETSERVDGSVLECPVCGHSSKQVCTLIQAITRCSLVTLVGLHSLRWPVSGILDSSE
ncbi:hypothetical protein E2C01_001528 [Portunus trituberculatus]|uniref:Uncharacterized protein n=1 Tax=Portunus trituberculatus TaxID=210409 RepID=A0A5B7CJI0_PORTR|nr:hypothetical protein [Portunus trituberculatus]